MRSCHAQLVFNATDACAISINQLPDFFRQPLEIQFPSVLSLLTHALVHHIYIFTSGCPTSSTTNPVVPYFTTNNHLCLILPLALYRDLLSDQPCCHSRRSDRRCLWTSPCTFADDTYLTIPATNKLSRHTELVNIHNWATRNNLQLNSDK